MVKIKLSRRLLANVLMISIVVLAIASLAVVYNEQFKPIKTWVYKGQTLTFRDDLRKADKIPVYPSKMDVYFETMHPFVRNVTIVYKEADEYGYYAVEAFEITYKMQLAFAELARSEGTLAFGTPTFNIEMVDQYANIPSEIENPTIALVHPMYANETAVRSENHVIYISGETTKGLDLATIKFLMVILGIELE